jgi:hypothetical protein
MNKRNINKLDKNIVMIKLTKYSKGNEKYKQEINIT